MLCCDDEVPYYKLVLGWAVLCCDGPPLDDGHFSFSVLLTASSLSLHVLLFAWFMRLVVVGDLIYPAFAFASFAHTHGDYRMVWFTLLFSFSLSGAHGDFRICNFVWEWVRTDGFLWLN